MILILAVPSAWSGAVGIVKSNSVGDQFLTDRLTMQKYFDRKSILADKDASDLNGDIYEYGVKSPFKAFLFSLAIPGAGEYYNGQKIRAGAFLAVDAIFWSGFFIYHSKGANMEKDYKAYANANYSWQEFIAWWDQLPEAQKEVYSHRMPYDYTNNIPIFNREYYENIGKYDQFQIGWPGGLNHPFIPGDSLYEQTYMPAERRTYLDMRKKSNDYFTTATTMVMISIANHIVSAFDAAIGAKRFNKGSKQYSLNVDARQVNGKTMPFLVFEAKF